MGTLKERITGFMRKLPQEALRLMRLYPVEAVLIFLEFVGCIFMYELKWNDSAILTLALLPLFSLGALALNILTEGSPWRKLYWVCWVPLIPLMLWNELDVWADEGRLVVAMGLLAPLALLMCRRALDNDRFVGEALVWLRSALLAGLFANVAVGLFLAILHSTIYIFSLQGDWAEMVTVYALIFAETYCMPMLFLGLVDRWRGIECRGNRIVEVLLNWIFSPALLIYAGILYLYIFRIVTTWTLPRGGVAYLIFGFMLVALVVKGLQSLLAKRIYDWFFDRFSLLSLPMAVLFWVGTLQRIGEYGMTAPRVWLVVCGGLMTFCVVLFLSRRMGRYLWVATAGFLAFGMLIFVPPMYPERVALRSQTNRAQRISTDLGLLDSAGRFDPAKIAVKDSLELNKLYAALYYLKYADPKTFERFGLTDLEALEVYSEEWRADETRLDEFHVLLTPSVALRMMIDNGYKKLYVAIPETETEVPSYQFNQDTLRLQLEPGEPVIRVPAQQILDHCLQQIGTPAPSEAAFQSATDSMFVYDMGKTVVLFSYISLSKENGTLHINWVSISDVLTR